MFREAPYAVRWAGWYVVILGLLTIPLFFYYAVKFEEISEPGLSAALTVYTGGWAILRSVVFIPTGFLLAKGFRPAFPVVLVLMTAGIIQAITTFEQSARFFGPGLAWIAIAIPVPALLQLMTTPPAWQWFLGRGGPKGSSLVTQPHSFELPRRQ